MTDNKEDLSKYDCDSQEFSFCFPKVNKSEHFPDLDMIGKLLIPKKKHTIKPVIEDCSQSEGSFNFLNNLFKLLSFIIMFWCC